MLFLESNFLNYAVDGNTRTKLLENLEEQHLTPMIRSTRLHCYDTLLSGADGRTAMETAISSWTESEMKDPFVKGDIFCFDDYVLFLVFEDDHDPMVRAGIIFEAQTAEPFRKLDSFCKTVGELISRFADLESNEPPRWHAGNQTVPDGFRSFVAKQDVDSLYTSFRKETMSRRIVAASKLEDEGARDFLRTARDAHLEGYAAKLLTGDTTPYNLSIERLEDVGLVEREVQVSCRKTGHALFRLPNAHALAVVTVSDATCSECGAPVADESVEEVIAPTQLASSLLEDGSWLTSRLHFLLREMGVPEREIALGPSEGTGYGQMMANVCGESFLIVTRDGDLTPAFARWSIDLEIETQACHLVIVSTGRIHKEAGVLLQNHARRRISGGQDFEMILAGDVATAGKELQKALERVSHRVLAEQLCVLDDSLGMNLSRLIRTKFQLRRASDDQTNAPSTTAEADSPFSQSRPALSLAAHASAGGDVIDLDRGSFDIDPTEVADTGQAIEPEIVPAEFNSDRSVWNE